MTRIKDSSLEPEVPMKEITLGIEAADGSTNNYTISLDFSDFTLHELEAAALLAGPNSFVDEEGNEIVGAEATIAMLFVSLYRQLPELGEDDYVVFRDQLLPAFTEAVSVNG